MIVRREENRPRALRISFEFVRPVTTTKNEYLYVYKNQANSFVYRINEDGTEDLIYNHY